MPNVMIERKSRWATLWRLPMFRYTSLGAGVCILATVLLPLWRLFPDLYGLPVIPLHYNIHYGVDWTGPWWQIFLFPAMSMSFVLLNSVVAWYVVRRNVFLASLTLLMSVVISLAVFAAMVFVVSVNIVYG